MADRESIREELEELIQEKEKDISGEEKERLVDETVQRLNDEEEKEENDIVTRRNFLKLTGLGIGGLAFSSLASSQWITNSTGAKGLAKTLANNNSAGVQDMDMNKNQILNLSLDKRTSDPSSPVEGQIWFRTDL